MCRQVATDMPRLVAVSFSCFCWGQDELPEQARRDRNSGIVYPSRELQQLMEFIAVANPLPATFKETKENRIIDPGLSLQGFWKKLETLSHPVRIVHIGDSHVRGHVFLMSCGVSLKMISVIRQY